MKSELQYALSKEGTIQVLRQQRGGWVGVARVQGIEYIVMKILW